MLLNFLQSAADTPLTKSFALENGRITKHSYPNVKNFNSYAARAETIEQFAEILQAHADRHHCLLKGELTRDLVNETRAGATDPNANTQWLWLDVDREETLQTAEQFIECCLPTEFQDVDYILHHSSSAGVTPEKGLSIHIGMLLSEPTPAPVLKLLLEQINLDNPVLSSQLSLSASGASMRYKLDTTTCQNDKLLFIAPPICGEGVEDAYAGQRIQVVKKTHRTLTVRTDSLNPESIRIKRDTRINELRKDGGLTKKSPKYTTGHGYEVLTNPDQAIITGQKTERGFVYFNLNGGDSWAYYHPEGYPDRIFNFKEPGIAYETKDLLPAYWAQIPKDEPPKDDKPNILIFRDFATATYWNGYVNPATKTADMARASGKDQLRDFLKQNGMKPPPYVPDWRYEFDPSVDHVVDFKDKFLNKFVPTDYMRTTARAHTVPPMTYSLIHHVLGNDDEATEHFLNWFAFIFQKRCKSETAWVITGTEGTGKGVLYHRVLRPLMGDRYCAQKPLSALQDQFNDWEEVTLLLNINEARISDSAQTSAMMNRLKAMITEPHGHVRRMHQSATEVKLFTNVLITSNNQDAVYISAEDRRFNVSPRQNDKIRLTAEHINMIDSELDQFAAYLRQYKVDETRARTALMNDAKQEMQHAALTSPEHLFYAIQNGDLEYFTKFLTHTPSANEALAYAAYETAVKRWIAALSDSWGACDVTRTELQDVYGYLQGERFSRPNKFTKLLTHNNINLRRTRINGNLEYAINVTWNKPDDDVSHWLDGKVTQLRKA